MTERHDPQGLEGPHDAVLHLLDRQISDDEGHLVGKADDLELTEERDGRLVLSALMVGPSSLIPRLGGRFGDWLWTHWVQLGGTRAERADPFVIDFSRVDYVDSGIHLSVGHRGVLQRRQDDGVPRHRLGELRGMRVEGPEVPARSRVIDLRLERDVEDPDRRIQALALVVGRQRPFGMLGYDRSPDQGPILLARAVRWLHRHSGLAHITDADLDWGAGVVRIHRRPEPLLGARNNR